MLPPSLVWLLYWWRQQDYVNLLHTNMWIRENNKILYKNLQFRALKERRMERQYAVSTLFVYYRCVVNRIAIYWIMVRYFFTYIPCILIIIKVFSPTDAQLNNLKKKFKFLFKAIQSCISWWKNLDNGTTFFTVCCSVRRTRSRKCYITNFSVQH
jgi:hypothetical protein